mmetsp:Transcript_53544/g.164684  ORF Transcript_53544/g.164684 Transcript_53544/m.164684 type:complete len:247 (+) Transcript_53544:154-894(+)
MVEQKESSAPGEKKGCCTGACENALCERIREEETARHEAVAESGKGTRERRDASGSQRSQACFTRRMPVPIGSRDAIRGVIAGFTILDRADEAATCESRGRARRPPVCCGAVGIDVPGDPTAKGGVTMRCNRGEGSFAHARSAEDRSCAGWALLGGRRTGVVRATRALSISRFHTSVCTRRRCALDVFRRLALRGRVRDGGCSLLRLVIRNGCEGASVAPVADPSREGSLLLLLRCPGIVRRPLDG